MVSRSGGCMSARRPHSKRERRRSSESRNVLGRRIARNHDLLLVIVQLIEGVKELFLGALFIAEELDIVHEQDVGLAIALVELLHALGAYAGDHVVHEALAGGIDDAHGAVAIDQLAADGVHQMGLAHAHAAVQEQRIVAARGVGGHGFRGGVSELVAGADDERIEGEFRIEGGRGGVGFARTGAQRRRCHGLRGARRHRLITDPPQGESQFPNAGEDEAGVLRFEPRPSLPVGHRNVQGIAFLADLGRALEPIVETFDTHSLLQVVT